METMKGNAMLKNIILKSQECIENRTTSILKLNQIAKIKKKEIENKVN